MLTQTLTTAPSRVRRMTITLPTGLKQDLIRLAELRGRDFATELSDDLTFVLRLTGGPRPGDMLEHLFAVSHLPDTWERVSLELPRAQADLVGAIARSYGVTRGVALSALLLTGVKTLLKVETLALSQGLGFMDAWFVHMGRQAA